MAASANADATEEEGSPYAGWAASLLLVVLVLAIGAGLWFHYHGF
jgi:hypothetical protein